jgi:DNA-binding HxlR family transcriptional regulator
MLTLDLKKLEKSGIISRSVLAEGPVKVEYKLTPVGTELGKIIHQLENFGEKIANQHYARPISLNS